MRYDRLSPPTVARRDSLDGSLNVLEDGAGGAPDPSHSPLRNVVRDLDTHSSLWVGKNGMRVAFVTPPPVPLAASTEAVVRTTRGAAIN